jgi:nucleoid-associated protein YgaU
MVVLVATGAFTIASAGTAAAVTWPSGSTASAAQLTSATRSTQSVQSTQQQGAPISLLAMQAMVAEAHAISVAEAQQAVAQQKAAAAAAAKKAAAKKAAAEAKVKAEAAKKKPAAKHSGTPKQIAEAMLSKFGWSSSQFSCLEPLWNRESGWDITAYNAGSGAYGIPQALPGSKMASAGPDWQGSAYTQVKWGLGYIKDVYGSPCGAWAHEEDTGWY